MSRKSTIETRAARAFAVKNYARAVRHLQELLEIVGENPQTLYMLALCHSRQHQPEQALAAAGRALDADPNHLATLKLMARIHFMREEHARARTLVARALELDRQSPETPRRWWARGTARPAAERLPSPDADEDRQWRVWAEAYLAARAASDDDGV